MSALFAVPGGPMRTACSPAIARDEKQADDLVLAEEAVGQRRARSAAEAGAGAALMRASAVATWGAEAITRAHWTLHAATSTLGRGRRTVARRRAEVGRPHVAIVEDRVQDDGAGSGSVAGRRRDIWTEPRGGTTRANGMLIVCESSCR